MGLFDSIQNLIGGIADSAQGSTGDVIGNIGEVPVVQDLQEQVSIIADGAADTTNSVAEQGQTLIDNVSQSIEPK